MVQKNGNMENTRVLMNEKTPWYPFKHQVKTKNDTQGVIGAGIVIESNHPFLRGFCADLVRHASLKLVHIRLIRTPPLYGPYTGLSSAQPGPATAACHRKTPPDILGGVWLAGAGLTLCASSPKPRTNA